MNVASPVIARIVAAVVAVLLASPATAAETVRVGSMPIDSSANAFYALEMGFFAKNGLDVKIETLPNGAVIGSAVAGGTLDVGFSNLTSIATAISRGLPFQMIAPAGLYSSAAPTTLTYVLAGSPVKSPKDLDGKIVAISGLKNAQEGSVRAWVDADGGHSATVKIVDLPFPQMPDALVAGRVDAIFIAEPSLSRVQKSPQFRLLGSPYNAISKQFLIGAWFAPKEWITGHRTAALAFVKSIREASDWANAHPADSAPILSKYTNVPVDVVRSTTRSKYGLVLDAADIQPELDNAAKYGYFPPLAASSLFVTLESR